MPMLLLTRMSNFLRSQDSEKYSRKICVVKRREVKTTKHELTTFTQKFYFAP
ncbi:unnamed protein product [Cylicostephanus goldi]|uniref:Uncharacterized protein n=1 Tax=Cylicostephanus goldi TaxID=71465 RepID=A0A3P6SZS0_CYLGO|nr:unnamed protein product [Cylicostephanus goldi]